MKTGANSPVFIGSALAVSRIRAHVETWPHTRHALRPAVLQQLKGSDRVERSESSLLSTGSARGEHSDCVPKPVS